MEPGPWCPRGAGGEEQGAGWRSGGHGWLPTLGLFLSSKVFGPGLWVPLPAWLVLESLLLLTRWKLGHAGGKRARCLSTSK